MATTVRIDENRITHVDGRPFFLIGARHMPVGATPAMLEEVGFNAYRHLVFGNESSKNQQDLLPRDTGGLYFWAYLYDRADFTKSRGYEAELRDAIRRLREHPDLLCYENLNEPTLMINSLTFKSEPENLARGTARVREWDPDHPIWLAHCCHNTVETIREFNASLDIVGCNPYPVYVPGMRPHVGVRSDGRMLDCPDQSIHAVGKYTDKMMRLSEGKPVWMLIQAMANEHWYSEQHNPEFAGQGIDRSKVLYPTHAEMRFMTYDAIVSGATGIAFAMHLTPAFGRIWEDIKELVGELRGLHDALCSPPVDGETKVEYHDLGATIWDGVRTLVRRRGDEVYLFAVNTSFDPAQVTIRLPVSVEATAEVLSEGRKLRALDGVIEDRFEAYGVHVYRLKALEKAELAVGAGAVLVQSR